MKILRTPDDRFDNLPDYTFEPHYTEIRDEDGTSIRVHHIEEGRADAAFILLMHGNPTWAFLYRKMVPALAKAGRRVIAVDIVGCGRPDKPAARDDYTLARHYDWMSKWLVANDLEDITLFCQDWGGTIGLYLVSEFPERFARIIKFPLLIAVQTDNPGAPLNRKAWEKLKTFDKPFLTIFGALDPVSQGWDKRAQAAIPGAKGQDHFVIEHARHFIQEDAPEILVESILRFLDR